MSRVTVPHWVACTSIANGTSPRPGRTVSCSSSSPASSAQTSRSPRRQPPTIAHSPAIAAPGREAAERRVAREPVRAGADQRLLVARRPPAGDEDAARARDVLGGRRAVLGDHDRAHVRGARRRQRPGPAVDVGVVPLVQHERRRSPALRRRGRTVRGRRARRPRHGRRRSGTRMASAQHRARGGHATVAVAIASPRVNVLALYDIHGNIDALEAVLADPRAADPDVVLVGGDVVPGPFARATLDRLARARHPLGPRQRRARGGGGDRRARARPRRPRRA